MPGLAHEAEVFLRSVMAGTVVYGAYTLIRIFRRLIKHNLLSISIEDFLFWVGTSFYLFIQIYEASDGAVRWFLVIGIAAGMVFAAIVVSALGNIWKKVCGKLKKRVDKTWKTR